MVELLDLASIVMLLALVLFCQVSLFKYMKNIYVFIIAIAYGFAVRANQFTKKFVRRSACHYEGKEVDN